MKFTYYDLGYLKRGRTVVVTLSGNEINVRLLDSSNFNNFKHGRACRGVGGRATKSPIRLTTSHAAHWYLVFDFGGYAGRTKCSYEILPEALPEIRFSPYSDLSSLLRTPKMEGDEVLDYDVFISHASEDKDEVVRPLANALKERGVKVWYDEFELKIGDSLRRKIDKGVANSRFGIAIISKSFIRKGWTNYELDGIITRQVSGEQILLPIWHNITNQEVMAYSPTLSDKLARNTAFNTIEEIADEIATLINNEP